MAKLCKKPKQEEIKTDPDAWEGFDHAVDAAVKSGPEHRTAKQNPMHAAEQAWVKTNMTRRHGRAQRGQRLVAKAPYGRWRTLTFLAALRVDRIDAPLVLDGPINGRAFTAYVEQFLVPTLARRAPYCLVRAARMASMCWSARACSSASVRSSNGKTKSYATKRRAARRGVRPIAWSGRRGWRRCVGRLGLAAPRRCGPGSGGRPRCSRGRSRSPAPAPPPRRRIPWWRRRPRGCRGLPGS